MQYLVAYEPDGPRWLMWFLRSPSAAAAGQARSRSDMIAKARSRIERSHGVPRDSFDIKLLPPD